MIRILFLLLFAASLANARPLIERFLFNFGPNVYFSQDSSSKKVQWIGHYGLEASAWYVAGWSPEGSNDHGLWGIDVGWDRTIEWDKSKSGHTFYLQFQTYAHNPFAKNVFSFPPGISFGPTLSISHETGKMSPGIQLDLWIYAFGGGGYRYRPSSYTWSPHQYGIGARVPFTHDGLVD
jgi:hypothetical protein